MDTLRLSYVWCTFAVFAGMTVRTYGCQGLLYNDTEGQSICYWLILSEQTAQQSEEKCNAEGGMLAYIPNADALNVVGTLKSEAGFTFTPEFFVGYREIGGELHVWGTSIVQTYHNWKSGQPSMASWDCVIVYNLGVTWWDEDCNANDKAVCSDVGPRPGTTTTTTTSTTTTPPPVPMTPVPTTTTTPVQTTTTTPLTTTTTTPLTTTTTTPLTTTRPTTTSSCIPCPCYSNTTSNKTIEEFREEIRKELIIEKKTLSSTIRQKTSATDPRPSAAAVGYIGVIILTVELVGLILMDAGNIYTCVKALVTFTKKWLK